MRFRLPQCYSQDQDPYSLFGTKTSYFEVAPDEAGEDFEPIEFPGCKAK